MAGRSGNTTEIMVNGKIAEILNRRHGWTASAERTQRVVGNKSLKPDIIVEAHNTAVIVETEYPPANGLDGDVDRIVEREIVGIGKVSSVIGMIIPTELKNLDGEKLKLELAGRQDFLYYVRYGNKPRFPTSGYLTGSLSDLAAAINLTSIPWDKVDLCVSKMENSIKKISHGLEQADLNVRNDICMHIRQKSSMQTWDMAGLIILNAGIFYEELAAKHEDIVPLSKISTVGILSQKGVIDVWDKVMKEIDYVPIFKDAVEIIRSLPGEIAGDVLDVMYKTVSEIIALKVTKSGDVYGSLYQNMLEDRKKIAAFYTRPKAAALLTGLVMPTSDDDIWTSENRIKNMRIADFACGTGMLLTHAYYHIRHSTSYDMTALHKHMMENCFYGYDIMPTATHLTVSNLAGLVPDELFDMSNIYTLPIGKKKNGPGYDLGSLDLIEEMERLTDVGIRHGGRGSESTHAVAISHHSCDYILMNPPYARATNHGPKHTDPVPPFAVFGNTPETQLAMSERGKRLYSDTCAHGNAGLASNFMAICDRKLRGGGSMGMILPATVPTGTSWSKVRNLLTEWYDDITLVLVGRGSGTYSSDTGMNEVMLTGCRRKTKRTQRSEKARIKLALLDQMPTSRLEAIEIAKQIRTNIPIRMENDMGHTTIRVGDDTVGRMISCPTDGDEWWVSNAANTSLISLAYNLIHGLLDEMPMTQLEKLGKIGKIHRDIADKKNEKDPRAPFRKIKYQKDAKYACLWNNDADTQQTMVVKPDYSLEVKHNVTMAHVKNTLSTATRVHVNCQVGYGSQRLIAAYTTDPILGGRTWPNITLDKSYEKAFTVWCNSIFGILTYWLISGSQHPGRGHMGKTAFKTFPVMDLKRISKTQIAKFDKLFDDLCNEKMLQINHLEQDEVRQKLDQRLCKILGIKMDLAPIYNQLIDERQFGRRTLELEESDAVDDT